MTRIRSLTLILAAVAAMAALAAAPAQAVEPGVNIGLRNTTNVSEDGKSGEAGAKWARLFVDWSMVELTDNVYALNHVNSFRDRVDAFNARGIKVLMVVSYSPAWASGSTDRTAPPHDPAKYAEFVAYLAQTFRGKVSAFELWNEPDDGVHWKGGPNADRYAALVKATYPRVKAVAPEATVLTGGMVGNNYEWLEQLYGQGIQGYFDAVGIHTDTACLTASPDEYYREPDGRIGRFSFTGYREVRDVLLARGDDKPLWMTEFGWSTTPAICNTGERAGTKDGGVTEAKQAEFLTRAYQCLQTDPYVQVALWFSLQDVDTSSNYDHRLGLLRDNGSEKPSFGAMRSWAANPTAQPCGGMLDHAAPSVSIAAPTAGQQYVDKLVVRAAAADAGVGVTRMELYADGQKVPGSQQSDSFSLEWNGAKNLSMGTHRLTIKAYDAAQNVGEATVQVVKDRPENIKVPPAKFAFALKKSKRRRTVIVSGRVSSPGHPIQPAGKVRMLFEIRRGKSWKLYSRYTKDAKKAFKLAVKVKKPGRWRMYARYTGKAPYKPLRTKYYYFKAH